MLRCSRILRTILANQEQLMASMADLNAKADAIKTSVDQLIARPSVATQADLDALGEKLDAINVDVNAALNPSSPPAS